MNNEKVGKTRYFLSIGYINMLRVKLPMLLAMLLLSLSGTAQKKLIYENKAYEPSIKTVQLFQEGGNIQAAIAPAVKSIDEGKRLRLTFDDLRDDADYYFVYFIHCNADWSPSDLRPAMYMKGYNEFEIESFEFSSEAKTNYVHYSFLLPEFKESGNYLAVVYRDRDKKDLILSRRFSIYDNRVGVGGRIGRSSEVSKRLQNQRIEVTINYADLKSINPSKDFTIVVRQNQRPDRTIAGLKPTFIDENGGLIRYQNLGRENDFPGGNEFRSFDISTVNFTGRNVSDIRFQDGKPVANLRIDRERDAVFFQQLDLNGQYYVRDLEGRLAQTSEYVAVKFHLDHPEINDKIHVIGAFNNWQKNEESLLKFDLETKRYYTTLLLKQGWYDYAYSVSSNTPALIDKDFFETENLYEIFVYYRPMGGRGDQLVGYQKISYNARR